MNKWVLIFSLGPVQSFIAEARRTGDLWAGSKLLVELARAAAIETGGVSVYPAREALEDKSANVPNKFVVIVDDPKAVAERAEKKAREVWERFASNALTNSGLKFDDHVDLIQKRQRDEHLEFYWVAAEIKEGNYIEAYKLAARALDARKRTRTFEQVAEDGPKDSLSGQRSALPFDWRKAHENQPRDVKEGERLDTIGVMKRWAFAGKGDDVKEEFPSVSTVAARTFAKPCSQESLSEFAVAIEKYNHDAGHKYFYQAGKWLPGLPYDGDLLYRETYARNRLKASYGESSLPTDGVQSALECLYNRAEKQGIRPSRPSPYYAILMMDGDEMGKHISACGNEDEHGRLSERLARFAKRVKDIVDEHDRYLVYTGGDDVLAFFPMKTVLDGTWALIQEYRKTFDDWKQFRPDGKEFPFTASAGIAIAHHLQPLEIALKAARQAEHIAKSRYDRAAVCVSVLRRSGEPLQVGSKWEAGGRCLAEWLGSLVDDFMEAPPNKGSRLSSRLAHEFHQQVTTLGGIDEDMLTPLLKRLWKRHRSETNDPRTSLDDLIEWVKAFQADVTGGNAGELARWLLLARFLAQGGVE